MSWMLLGIVGNVLEKVTKVLSKNKGGGEEEVRR